jgi:hypothetical protein
VVATGEGQPALICGLCDEITLTQSKLAIAEEFLPIPNYLERPRQASQASAQERTHKFRVRGRWCARRAVVGHQRRLNGPAPARAGVRQPRTAARSRHLLRTQPRPRPQAIGRPGAPTSSSAPAAFRIPD